MSDESSEPTIQVDSDWKAEAQREKQKLLAQEQERRKRGGPSPSDPAFVDLLNMLAMQAAVSLGGYEAPNGETLPPDLAIARQQIAMIEALERKTEGNLSDEERRGLHELLHSLRMQYVKVAQAGPSAGAAGPAGAPA